MKTLILLPLLFLSIIVKSQNEIIDTTINNICKERGHILSELSTSTLMYCPSYIIDTDSTTIEVFPACNWVTYICKRCGQEISERNKERRVVLWKKE